LQQIISGQQAQATAVQLQAISQQLTNILLILLNVQTTNAQGLEQVEVLENNALAQLGAIATKVGALTSTSVGVSLPATPPPGYGGPSSGAVASDVWHYADPFTGQTMLSYQEVAGVFPSFLETVGWVAETAYPWWGWQGPVDEPLSTPPTLGTIFPLDTTTILPTDATVLDWLERVYPGSPWGVVGGHFPGIPDNHGTGLWVVTMTPDEFKALGGAGGSGGGTVYVPPVWPGLAHVTLGAPVAISEAFMVAGPMHGVIVDLSSVSPKKTTYDIDGQTAHRQIGSLVFVNDDGKAESFQALRFEHEVFVPKTFKEAANCFVQCDSSDVGTVTPWTTTS
jgi:hypothetical protein